MMFNTRWVTENTHSEEVIEDEVIEVDASDAPLDQIIACMQAMLTRLLPANWDHVTVRCAGAWPV